MLSNYIIDEQPHRFGSVNHNPPYFTPQFKHIYLFLTIIEK